MDVCLILTFPSAGINIFCVLFQKYPSDIKPRRGNPCGRPGGAVHNRTRAATFGCQGDRKGRPYAELRCPEMVDSFMKNPRVGATLAVVPAVQCITGQGRQPSAARATVKVAPTRSCVARKCKNPNTQMGIRIFGGSPGTRLHFCPGMGKNRGSARSSPRRRRSSAPHGIIRVPFHAKIRIPKWVFGFLVARQGLEPWTHALKGRCSTN